LAIFFLFPSKQFCRYYSAVGNFFPKTDGTNTKAYKLVTTNEITLSIHVRNFVAPNEPLNIKKKYFEPKVPVP
jgi:hypothetical protein